jgi:hypothetical protein
MWQRRELAACEPVALHLLRAALYMTELRDAEQGHALLEAVGALAG